MTTKQAFAREMVQVVTALLWQYQRLQALSEEWARLGYGPGAPAEITDADLSGANLQVSAADLAGALTTLDALKALMDQGHGTNLYKLYRRGV